MKKILFVLTVICIALLCSCSDFVAGTTGKNQILSIGLSYKGTAASELRGTLNDAMEVGACLSEVLNSKSIPRELTYMLQEDLATDDKESALYPSKDHVLAMVDSLEVGKGDMLTVFYSGHGQDVYWGTCGLCGKSIHVFSDGKKPTLFFCPYCDDNMELAINLTQAAATYAAEPLKSTAAGYLNKTVTKEAYLSALREAGTDLAKEILSVSDYLEASIPEMDMKARAFLVTAPLEPVEFRDWLRTKAVDGGISGWLSEQMDNDKAMPKASAYLGKVSDYHDAVYNRLMYYGAVTYWIDRTFEKLWTDYERESWTDTCWTVLYMDEFVDRLEAKGCRTLFISDCCYSGYITEGRDDEPTGFGQAFISMFSKGNHGNVTVVSASASDQTSLDSLVYNEEGTTQHHGLFTIALLKSLGWMHSDTKFVYERINGSVEKVWGYQKEIPERKTMRQVMEEIRSEWSYMKQTPLINATYLDVVIIP